MDETKTNRGSGLKYFLFIGIPVLIILGMLGIYYHLTNPMTILTKTINTAYENVDKMIKNSNQSFNLKENPFTINGNLEFSTDANLNGYEDLQKYNYNFNLGIDYKEELLNIELGINENNKNILNAFLYQIGNKQYLKSEKLLNGLLDITSDTNTLPFEETVDIEGLNYEINSNDIKMVLKKMKDYFIESLNKNYINREKTDITIDEKTVKATKISYLLNEENQKRTYDFIIDKIANDNELLVILAKMTSEEVNSLKTQITDSKNDFNYEGDVSLFIYTEGLNQNVIRASLAEDSIDEITYINYNNKKSINIENDLILTINEISEETMDIDYELKENNISGKIKINGKEEATNKTSGTIFISIDSNSFKGNFTLQLEIDTITPIEKPDTTNAKKLEELSPEETLDIFSKLENALKGTNFYDLIENNIM